MWSIQNIDLAFAGAVLFWLYFPRVLTVGVQYRPGCGAVTLIGTVITFLLLMPVAAYINSATPPFGILIHRMILIGFLMAVWFQVNNLNTTFMRTGERAPAGLTLLIMLILLIFIGIRVVRLF